MSAMTHLECARCGMHQEARKLQNLCACGAPLLARYDLATVATTVAPEGLLSGESTLWRYEERCGRPAGATGTSTP